MLCSQSCIIILVLAGTFVVLALGIVELVEMHAVNIGDISSDCDGWKREWLG